MAKDLEAECAAYEQAIVDAGVLIPGVLARMDTSALNEPGHRSLAYSCQDVDHCYGARQLPFLR